MERASNGDTCSSRAKSKQYPYGTSFLAIAQEYQQRYEDDIVLAVYNNRLRELGKQAKRDGMLEFITTADKTGKKTYRRSVTFLMQKAVFELWGERTDRRARQIFHRSGVLLRTLEEHGGRQGTCPRG